jgi:hypothetical protein
MIERVANLLEPCVLSSENVVNGKRSTGSSGSIWGKKFRNILGKATMFAQRNWFRPFTFSVLLISCCFLGSARAEVPVPTISQALETAGENKSQLEKALAEIEPEYKVGMEFLIRNMPEQDTKSLSADFLLENVRLAYQAWKTSKWQAEVPEEVFLNNVLPYCVVNEARDPWRKEFMERFAPLIKDCKTPGEAAAVLNGEIFGIVQVKYSTKRPKPDQSPAESMKAGLASCSGLSILLIDACRALGVPARFVGTPLWADGSGNHSWVEVWDQGDWYFTGACEATGKDLNQGWFTGRASQALVDDPLRAIYATSFKRTPIHFPLVWDRRIRWVYAVNVTPRYAGKEPVPAGHVETRFVYRPAASKERQVIDFTIVDATSGDKIFEGKTRDERFDANDHTTCYLITTGAFKVQWKDEAGEHSLAFEKPSPGQVIELKQGP